MIVQYWPSSETTYIELLEPVSWNNKTVSFKLILVCVLSKPKYTALSYTWDNMDEPSSPRLSK